MLLNRDQRHIRNLPVSHIQTYNEYNRGLDELLSTANVERYPVLCSSMTEAFNKLSESVIRIKVRN